MLYTLNLYNVIYQLYLNKTGKISIKHIKNPLYDFGFREQIWAFWQRFTYLFFLITGSFSGQDSDKMGISMSDIQCLLDKEGASELVIDVIVNTKNDRIFSEGILLGIALLEGGNTQTQVPAYNHCCWLHLVILYFLLLCLGNPSNDFSLSFSWLSQKGKKPTITLYHIFLINFLICCSKYIVVV